MKRFTQISSFLFYLLTFGVFVVFLIVKYRFGLIRYVDMDEWAYLNWTSHMVTGTLPYRDFGFIYPPGYLLFLSPLFLISSDPTFPLIGGRVLAFVVFTLLCVVMMLLFYRMRKRWTAILVGALLVFLPLPSDKFIEIRPDTLAMLFAMTGTLCQVIWMSFKVGRKRQLFMFGSGFLYGLSVFISQKTIPHVMFATGIALWWVYETGRSAHQLNIKTLVRTVAPYILGGGVILVVFLGWMLSTGYGGLIWYSIIQMPKEIARLGYQFPLPPLYYFHYIDMYYGIFGLNWGYMLNHIFWIVGLTLAGCQFIRSVYISFRKKKQFSDILLSGVCLMQVVLFVWYFPLKHSQYLIPIAVLVVFYVTDGITTLWVWARSSHWRLILFSVGFFVLLTLLAFGYRDVNAIKFIWWNGRNDRDIQMVTTMVRTIPRQEYILDLVGVSLYFPQPYYSSCTPIGQLAPLVSKPFPPLIPALVATDTKFIYQGERFSTLSYEDQIYISTHFKAVDVNKSLLIRNDAIDQYARYFMW